VLIAFGGAEPGPLEPLTARTIADPERLAAEIRGCAAAAMPRRSTSSRWGSPASPPPVLGAGGRALAALSIFGPTLRLGAQQIADLYPQLIHEAQALGHDMGANAA